MFFSHPIQGPRAEKQKKTPRAAEHPKKTPPRKNKRKRKNTTQQSIVNGFQHEQPDYWLTFGNPWEIERLIVAYPIKFYGHVSVHQAEDGKQQYRWNAGETISAVAYDNPIPGFGTRNCINLRLWAAKPGTEFDLEAFNTGDYVQAILAKQRAETLSSVLYPDDRTYEGKELRLKQQHFFVSATIQDVVRRYREAHPETWDLFADKVGCFFGFVFAFRRSGLLFFC